MCQILYCDLKYRAISERTANTFSCCFQAVQPSWWENVVIPSLKSLFSCAEFFRWLGCAGDGMGTLKTLQGTIKALKGNKKLFEYLSEQRAGGIPEQME